MGGEKKSENINSLLLLQASKMDDIKQNVIELKSRVKNQEIANS